MDAGKVYVDASVMSPAAPLSVVHPGNVKKIIADNTAKMCMERNILC